MHLLVIFGIALLVFGPKGFRNLGRGSERRFAVSSRHARGGTNARRARAADIELKCVKVVDDLRITYPHFSFATRE
jgi:Sec-independent protein translocase protein TatA